MSRTIRILHFSPSTATQRHDSHRAALGIGCFIGEAIRKHRLQHRWELVWALPAIGSTEQVHALLTGADLLVVGTPTHGQGSPWFLRKFFELSSGAALWTRPASAFATAGGMHTGGETAVADTLRSLQGLGAATFSFAQKTLVFGTNQKFSNDGEFDLIDVWFMQQFARTILLHLVARDEAAAAESWAKRLGLDAGYYHNFPAETVLEREVGIVRDLLNSPLRRAEFGYAELSRHLGFDCSPPEARHLLFADLLPGPSREAIS